MSSEYKDKLLDELNQLEQKYGRVLVERDPNYDPSGEANARIQFLMQELTKMGIQLEWDGWQYQVIEHRPANNGEEGGNGS